jgi:menaquinone-specific isochorismate synthase
VKARTVPVDGPVDLLAFAGDDGVLFEREGAGLAGRGEALRVEGTMDTLPARAAAALAGIDGDAVALGALPFDRDVPGSLVVPQWLLRKDADGSAWLTSVGTDEPPPPLPAPTAEAPDGFSLSSTRSHADWNDTVRRAVEVVRSGRLQKVVLAREVVVVADTVIPVATVLGRLRALYPACRVFSVDGFVGASPEMLVSRHGTEVVAHPLAGTVARSGDPEADARLATQLLGSHKEREEHALVVDTVAEVLRRHCRDLDVAAEPTVVPFRNVSHLGTRLHGRLREPAASALDLAAALHPTPAVAGTPTEDALSYIAEVEKLDRGRYAGPVGWMDAHGDGEFAVGIRSAEIEGSRARLFAGVGIVAESDPEAELLETQLKLQALLAALVRP